MSPTTLNANNNTRRPGCQCGEICNCGSACACAKSCGCADCRERPGRSGALDLTRRAD